MANEIRLRANNISGTITDNPLAIGATTVNSPGFVDLPTVDTTNHLILVLDPLESNGQAEIVQVTAHAASSSVCTIVRGFETTTPRAHPLGTAWFHGPVVSDWNLTQRTALSTNRPFIPFNGEMIYETDTHRFSSRLNGQWRPAPHNPPACRVFNSAPQSIPDAGAGTETTITFDSERYDTDTMHSTAVNTSRITFNTVGIYVVQFNGVMADAATNFDNSYCGIRRNGATVLSYMSGMRGSTTFGPLFNISVVAQFAFSDYVEAFILQSNVGNVARNVDTQEFSATWIGIG